MLDEEKRLGSSLEQLERIIEYQARIAQHERLSEGRANRRDTSSVQRVLNNQIKLQEVFWSHHQNFLAAANQKTPDR
ncbi:MAG TPA: hypothetical protein VMA30_11970 [Xanthobacteraceae bacterium]|nr:hypothetical protein [Xanthobacteraceae bacterium]